MRKLYDKGILHTSGKHYHTAETVYESQEDDAQTKFYKARMHRSKPTATGRTPIYDFDEWSKNHYGESFDRQQRAKKKYQEKIEKEESHVYSLQKEYILLGILTVFMTCMMAIKETTHYDIDRTKSEGKTSTTE
jgi:DnaJ family protein C protein 30